MKRTAPLIALVLVFSLLGNSMVSYAVDDPSKVDSPERRFDVIFFISLLWTLLWSYFTAYLISAVVRQEGVPQTDFDDEWQIIGLGTVFFSLAIAIYDVRKLNERLKGIDPGQDLPLLQDDLRNSQEDTTVTDGDKKN